MSLLHKLHPGPAFHGLRGFVRSRKRYQIWALAVSALIVVAIIFGFIKDSRFFPKYKAEITYFKSWPLDRSDAEIQAQMKIDNARLAKLRAERDKKQKARQAEFQKIDNTLSGWGL